jgi:hypothetical protein
MRDAQLAPSMALRMSGGLRDGDIRAKLATSGELRLAGDGAFDAARGWELNRAIGGGPFTSRLHWALPDGGEAVWESRRARRRGEIRVRTRAGEERRQLAPDLVVRHLRRVNWIASAAFTVGGSLFALGAFVAQIGSGDATTAASVYFVGGIFFSTGGYASLLGAINAPRGVSGDGALVARRWAWWSYEPERIDWAATFVLFIGTLAFAISLIDSFLQGLTTHQVNRLIWAPEVTGCVFFLVSGHLAMMEICHRTRPCLRPRDLGWWIVAVNQVGSVLFMVSALAAFIRPETSSAVNVDVANWGTFTGALCFAIGGVMQGFERPTAASGTSHELQKFPESRGETSEH